MARTDVFVVVTPAWRGIEANTAMCIERAHHKQLPFIWFPQVGDALIGRARSIAATRFMEKFDSEYLIMLDSDIVFEPEQLDRLYQDMKNGHQLVGGIYTVRGGQFLAHHGVDGHLLVDGTIREVQYLSTGFMGITKTLLQKIVDELHLPLCHPDTPTFRCYPFFENTAVEYNGKWIYESEDWDFCRKVRKVGGIPECDTSIMLGHIGERIWTFQDQPPEACRIPTKKEVKKAGGIWVPPNKRGKIPYLLVAPA